MQISPIIERALSYIEMELGEPLKVKILRREHRPNEYQPHRNGVVYSVLEHEFFIDNSTAESCLEPMGLAIIHDIVYGEIIPKIFPDLQKMINA